VEKPTEDIQQQAICTLNSWSWPHSSLYYDRWKSEQVHRSKNRLYPLCL